jgi:hypothetical protein
MGIDVFIWKLHNGSQLHSWDSSSSLDLLHAFEGTGCAYYASHGLRIDSLFFLQRHYRKSLMAGLDTGLIKRFLV